MWTSGIVGSREVIEGERGTQVPQTPLPRFIDVAFLPMLLLGMDLHRAGGLKVDLADRGRL